MNKTTIYLSEYTNILKQLTLDVYFPETELHPRQVAKLVPSLLGKSFCTHSETIINKLGHLIAEGKIDYTSIEIKILSYFKLDTYDVKEVRFDAEGYLLNWSLGFFNMETV